MDSELRRSYEEMVGAVRGAMDALKPQQKRRTRRRADIAQKLQAQLGQAGEGGDSALARYVSGMSRDLRGATPAEESPRVPGEHF